MLVNYIRLIVVYGLFAFITASYEELCKFASNITDVEELAHHKYQVLEDCLYYKLSQDATAMQGKSNAISILPPSIAAGETLDAEVIEIALKQLWMNEIWHVMNINGHFLISWKDRRMKWDFNEWKTDTLNIRLYGRLWVPDINSDKFQTSTQNGDYAQFYNIVAKNNGNVTGRLEFKMQAHCDIDYSNFPDLNYSFLNTIIRIVGRQELLLSAEISSLSSLHQILSCSGEDGLDLTKLRTNWHVRDATIKVLPDEDDRKTQMLEICLQVRRRSSTLRIELTLPMMVSSLLVVIAPFFGSFRDQINVKLFAIFIQLVSFTFLAIKAPQVGFGETVPHIYTFYVFTMSTTVVSLLLTLVISAMSRIRRKLPPAHRYTLLASALNISLCCGSEPNAEIDGTSAKDYHQDWLQIHTAINNVVSFLILVAYTIGIIVILCV
uniref:Neur_chan_LBD domain-containing protein n=1 Tax=Loa loa TaxID=7209 RepID=A0A1I7VLV1_LOALO